MATFKELVDRSSRIVFFGGAGVSTESGIPDFRSQDGLYNQKYSVPPETILSDTYFYAKDYMFGRHANSIVMLMLDSHVETLPSKAACHYYYYMKTDLASPFVWE